MSDIERQTRNSVANYVLKVNKNRTKMAKDIRSGEVSYEHVRWMHMLQWQYEQACRAINYGWTDQ